MEERTLRNILRWKAALTAAGIALWWLLGGGRHAAGFTAGAAASAASFYFLKQAAAVDASSKAALAKAALGTFRMLGIGILLFVIIRDYGLPPNAIAAGLLVTVLSITIEVIRQHFYA
jgi:hypothetical protein